MTRILITPEEMRQVAGRFRQASQQSTEIRSGLAQEINRLQSTWAGVTQQRFVQQFGEWQRGMEGFTEILETICRELEVIAERFEQADKS